MGLVETLIALAKRVSLTLYQWLLLTLFAACGILVWVLRMQGSKLHKTQADLALEQALVATAAEDANVDKAWDRYNEAYKAYTEAK